MMRLLPSSAIGSSAPAVRAAPSASKRSAVETNVDLDRSGKRSMLTEAREWRQGPRLPYDESVMTALRIASLASGIATIALLAACDENFGSRCGPGTIAANGECSIPASICGEG